MYASINLYSVKVGEIQRFLNNFFNTNIEKNVIMLLGGLFYEQKKSRKWQNKIFKN